MQEAPVIKNIKNTNIIMPKLGFVGVGWIGRSRLDCIAQHSNAVIAAVFDPSELAVNQAKTDFPSVNITTSFEEMLRMDLDGVVIATPSALHEQQTLQALEAGMAVFCQKPLARTAAATKKLVEKARENNVLLGVDFSYRDTIGIQKIKEVIDSQSIGTIFHANLIFHNAYGPDKSWYYDPALSGGGCFMDLGIHLVDLLFWLIPDLEIKKIQQAFYKNGQSIHSFDKDIEDFATVHLLFTNHLTAQLTCSWNVSAGQDALIEATFFGTQGSISFKNQQGSFYDFQTELYRGTQKEILTTPPDDWMGRTAAIWATQLADNPGFNENTINYIKVAEAMDKIYNK